MCFLPQVLVSWLAVAAFICIGMPAIVATTGWAGLAKYWLMPWLGYHFWMSTFTVIHHTAAHIPFKPAETWNAAQAQLAGTVHCDFPAWCGPLNPCLGGGNLGAGPFTLRSPLHGVQSAALSTRAA